ncbi:hypothetical protein [Flavobacterium sp. '19STA2R22 D10 B1']|uniref:hypothetical protein n=1 Tax=Flavobacterium aerium TaxID=3037261 RepID=UPI00278C7D9A|nr:hypothetical protein [Flavobacterium sp. '19STA2R22 D10 B1']
MNELNITSAECSWAHFEIKVLNRVIKGLRAFGFKKTVETEHLFGSGNAPIDITRGNITYEGSIKVLGFEADAMNKAAKTSGYSDITEVPHDMIVITCSFKRRTTDPISTYVATGVAFSENSVDMEQNAKYREITLPFLAMKIDF